MANELNHAHGCSHLAPQRSVCTDSPVAFTGRIHQAASIASQRDITA
jgi:hypothetical protein